MEVDFAATAVAHHITRGKPGHDRGLVSEAGVDQFGTAHAARQFQRWIASLHARDLLNVEPALQTLKLPTLFVWGTGDIFFNVRWARWLRDTIPGVTEVVDVDGGRLFFPDERADELVSHLRRFWSANPVHLSRISRTPAIPEHGDRMRSGS